MSSAEAPSSSPKSPTSPHEGGASDVSAEASRDSGAPRTVEGAMGADGAPAEPGRVGSGPPGSGRCGSRSGRSSVSSGSAAGAGLGKSTRGNKEGGPSCTGARFFVDARGTAGRETPMTGRSSSASVLEETGPDDPGTEGSSGRSGPKASRSISSESGGALEAPEGARDGRSIWLLSGCFTGMGRSRSFRSGTGIGRSRSRLSGGCPPSSSRSASSKWSAAGATPIMVFLVPLGRSPVASAGGGAACGGTPSMVGR